MYSSSKRQVAVDMGRPSQADRAVGLQRVAIIGCGGSGKSVLAIALGAKLGLPVHHLDRLFWQPGWVETPAAQWRALQTNLCAQPHWIIDGNYGGTLELRLATADAVIFVDLPTWTCLRGVLQRYFTYRGRGRPDMGQGCPERLGLEFLWWICTYRRRRRRPILARLQHCHSGQRVIVLQSRRATAEFLDQLELQAEVAASV